MNAYTTTQNNGLPCYAHKQKHMASDHIYVQTKFSNKLVNQIVDTELIHTNTETHHIYHIKRHNTPIIIIIIIIIMSTKKKKILLSMLIIYIYIYMLPPWGGCPSPRACGAYLRADIISISLVVGHCVSLKVLIPINWLINPKIFM